jgi:hypothetical protein
MIRQALVLILLAALALGAGCAGRRGTAPPPRPSYIGPDPTWLSARPTPEPDDPQVVTLEGELAAALDPAQRFELGAERFVREGMHRMSGRRTAILTTPDATISDGRHSVAAILKSPFPNFARVIVFIPEGTAQARPRQLAEALAQRPTLPVVELRAPDFRPFPNALDAIDFLVIDLPATGLRHTGEAAVLGAFLDEAAVKGTRVIVLDRPPVLGTVRVDGPVPDGDATGTLAAYLPMPPQPGLTPGEMALLMNGPLGIQATLRVVPMGNWTRAEGNASAAGAERARLLLETTAALLRGTLAPYDPIAVETPAGAMPRLRVRPTARAAAEVAGLLRAGGLVPEGALAVEGADLVVTGTEDFGASSLAAALAAAAEEKAASADVPADRGLFGCRWVFQARAQGADGAAWRRFWMDSEPYRRYLRQRGSVLLYPDQRQARP